MKHLHFDCAMGAAGDMLTAALLELFEDKDAICQELNALGVPHTQFIAEPSQKCGVTGTHIRVLIDGCEEHHEHAHHGLEDIGRVVAQLQVSEAVRAHIMAIYDEIARAESLVHGEPVEHIHFHEVGALDAIADVAAVCYLLEKLQPELITASKIHVGCGQVRCAHGILPVPAPATAEILKGIPIYGGQIEGELCTPTGAAILKHFVSFFGPMPAMAMDTIGYGMGRKDFPAANCVRALLGHTEEGRDAVVELCCNLDDMTPEEVGFAADRLFAAGALDVFTTAIGMKKNRPGILLTVLCKPEHKELLLHEIFRHTTTLGIRQSLCSRYVLSRETKTVQTKYGPVRKKIARGYGVTRSKWEYEDLARIAKEQNRSLAEIKNSFV